MVLTTGNRGGKTVVEPLHKDGAHQFCETTSVHENQTRALSENLPYQSTECFELVARATNDAVRDWNVITGTLSWPQGLEALLGYRPEPGQDTIAFWQERLHPEDRARVSTTVREALDGTDHHWSGEYQFRQADGTYLQLLERAVISRDANGKATRFVGSLMDITARKQLHDQLVRSQKMEAFGQLASGLAHDFNNFLTTILGYSDLVLAETGIKAAVTSHISEIRQAARRASILAGQLLAFSRKQPLAPELVEVNSLITNLERSLLRLLGDDIPVFCHLHHEKKGAYTRVDRNQITQIIVNLALNARDAMPSGGQLSISTAIVDLVHQMPPPFLCGDFLPGQYVVISVADTGAGMSDEAKVHLFEPFFTTKEKHSGLGLATTYGIVHQSGGHIRIESEPGQGTTALLYLPKVAPPPPAYKKSKIKNLPNGTETILVLEDDISVRHISVRMLRQLGYTVLEAANGDDAQRMIAETTTRKVHLLLTDVVMPRMSGRHFANWLRKISPKTKVVFVSGYLNDSLQPGDRLDNGMFFLPKPFDTEQLAATIRQALDS